MRSVKFSGSLSKDLTAAVKMMIRAKLAGGILPVTVPVGEFTDIDGDMRETTFASGETIRWPKSDWGSPRIVWTPVFGGLHGWNHVELLAEWHESVEVVHGFHSSIRPSIVLGEVKGKVVFDDKEERFLFDHEQEAGEWTPGESTCDSHRTLDEIWDDLGNVEATPPHFNAIDFQNALVEELQAATALAWLIVNRSGTLPQAVSVIPVSRTVPPDAACVNLPGIHLLLRPDESVEVSYQRYRAVALFPDSDRKLFQGKVVVLDAKAPNLTCSTGFMSELELTYVAQESKLHRQIGELTDAIESVDGVDS